MASPNYARFDRFLDHWDGVRFVTLELLRCFGDEDLDHRLVPEWRTVGELFHHIGGHQYFVARGLFLRRWKPVAGEPDEDWTAHREATCGSVATLEAWLGGVQHDMRAWAETAGPALSERLEAVMDDNPWHEGMRGWLLLHHPYQDELHHRGQLYAIARLLGKVPPMVYAEEHPVYWEPRKGR